MQAQLETGVLRDAVLAQSEAETLTLWSIREASVAFPTQLEPISFDVSLPIGDIGDFVDRCRRTLESRWPGLGGLYFGHVGDSNLHLTLDARAVPGIEAAHVEQAVYELVRAHRGSISAEHGIGTLKRPFLAHSRGAGEIACMQAIKRALDPRGILNPGKLLPDATRTLEGGSV